MKSLKNKIIENDGSVQNIPEIPEFIRMTYKTAWEIKQRHILDMAADLYLYVNHSILIYL